MCTSREKAVRHDVDLTIKVFDENSEITQRGEGSWMPIKDVQKCGVLTPKFCNVKLFFLFFFIFSLSAPS